MVCILTEQELRSMEHLAQRLESRGMAGESEALRNILRLGSERREVKASVAAEVYHVSSQTIRNWVKGGLLAGRIDDTGHVFVSVDALKSVVEMDAAMPYQPPTAPDFTMEGIQEVIDDVRARRPTGQGEGRRAAAGREGHRTVTRDQGGGVPEEDLLARDHVLAEMVHRLVDALHPDRIYLFGSRARGDAGPGSDYDLLAVVSHPDHAAARWDVVAYRALCGVGASKDVVVYTREEFESRSRAPSSLPATVLREGRLVYAA